MKRRALEIVFPLVGIALLGGISYLGYQSVFAGDSPATSSSQSDGVFSAPVDSPTFPKGYPVIFNRIESSAGTTYFTDVAEQPGVYDATDPVFLAIAIGGGLRFQKEGELARLNYGHLHVLIDSTVPGPLETILPDSNHIDLADGSYVITLPDLSPGPHTVNAVWTDSNNNTGVFVGYATLHINVIAASPR
ncbi:MAG: hypothetical protein ABI559_02740 [Chloroflexota bacterium]